MNAASDSPHPAAAVLTASIPAMVAPMFLISGPQLVIAACRAGLPAAFPAPNARDLGVLDQWLAELTEALDESDAPWMLNLIAHGSYPRLAEELKLVAKYRPRAVITALGSPREVIETVHGYGGLVLADVNSLPLARKAAAAGVDGLVLVCSGAGGHTGQLTPMTFVPAVRRFFDGLLIVGGGIGTGGGIRSIEALGADFAYLGTLFIASEESLASPEYKQMVVDCDSSDLTISRAVTGVPASWLVPSLRACGIDPEQIASVDFSGGTDHKRWRDIWSAGQGVGEVGAIRPTAQIVADLERQYQSAGTLA